MTRQDSSQILTSPALMSIPQPYAFESRDHLRALVVGKEINFVSIHSLPTTDGTPRDIGNASLGDVDLADEMLKTGWAKVKDNKREDTDVEIAHKELESQARSAGRGMDGCPTTSF